MDATFGFFDFCKLLASTVACDNLMTYYVQNHFLSFVWAVPIVPLKALQCTLFVNVIYLIKSAVSNTLIK